MMNILAILLLLLYVVFYTITFQQVLSGKIKFLLYYVAIFLPIYTVFLTITFNFLDSSLLIKFIQYSKEVVILSAFGLMLLGSKNILSKGWKVTFLDSLFISFFVLTLFFFLLPLGEAALVNKAVYLKNILLIVIFYFFGRNVQMSFSDWNKVFQVIFVVAIFATFLVSLEKILGIHFHTVVDYPNFLIKFQEQEPAGTYGLLWTFEAEGGKPRYGSFFAHPLELSSAMLIVGAAASIYLLSVKFKTNKSIYFVVFGCAILSVLFAYSRASLAAFILMMIFMAFMLQYYKILFATLIGVLFMAIYIWFFASNEIRYFAIDTLTFQNSSSITHLIDWFAAIESIINNPQGIGLAMSGNAAGVERDIAIGGENQFLVYGVQMGLLGMMIYLGLIIIGIRNGWKAYRMSVKREEGIVPFVAAATKFGLLLPLFTANAEVYIYISLISWWLIGAAETEYQRKRQSKLILST